MDEMSIEEKYEGFTVTEDIEKANRLFDSWNEEIYHIEKWSESENNIVAVKRDTNETINVSFNFDQTTSEDRWYLVKIDFFKQKE